MSNQVDTDLSEQTVEGQAQADTTNIQSENNQAGSTDHVGSGEVEQTEDIAIASEEVAPSPTEEVNSIGDINQYEAMKARLEGDPDALATAAPPEGEAEAAEEEVETQEEVTTPIDPTSAAALEAEAAETETESTNDEEAAAKRESQFRLRPEEKLDAEAFRIFKAAQSAQAPVSMSEALGLARNHLGIPDTQPNTASDDIVATDQEAEDSEDSVFDGITQDEAKQNLRDLRMDQNRAMRDGDLDEAADIGERIIDAEELIDVLGERESEAMEVATSERSRQFENSHTKAVETFPDFAKEDTEFFAKCREIDEALETTDDPRYYDANKPLLVAQMAARELNVAPFIAGQEPVIAKAAAVQNPSTPPQQSTSPQPARTEKPAPLPSASGASRTGGTTGASKDLQQKIADIANPEDFAKMAAAMGQVG